MDFQSPSHFSNSMGCLEWALIKLKFDTHFFAIHKNSTFRHLSTEYKHWNTRHKSPESDFYDIFFGQLREIHCCIDFSFFFSKSVKTHKTFRKIENQEIPIRFRKSRVICQTPDSISLSANELMHFAIKSHFHSKCLYVRSFVCIGVRVPFLHHNYWVFCFILLVRHVKNNFEHSFNGVECTEAFFHQTLNKVYQFSESDNKQHPSTLFSVYFNSGSN